MSQKSKVITVYAYQLTNQQFILSINQEAINQYLAQVNQHYFEPVQISRSYDEKYRVGSTVKSIYALFADKGTDLIVFNTDKIKSFRDFEIYLHVKHPNTSSKGFFYAEEMQYLKDNDLLNDFWDKKLSVQYAHFYEEFSLQWGLRRVLNVITTDVDDISDITKVVKPNYAFSEGTNGANTLVYTSSTEKKWLKVIGSDKTIENVENIEWLKECVAKTKGSVGVGSNNHMMFSPDTKKKLIELNIEV